MAEWRLLSVRVLRFQGIGRQADPVELLDLHAGINLIWAPNRRGKSCTARAIRAAMASDPREAIGAIVTLEYDSGDEVGAYEYNARRDAFAALPAGFENVAGRYQLALHDLLQQDDRDLAKAFLDEIYGGLDLDAIGAGLGYGANIAGKTKPGGELRQAKARLKDLRNEHGAVRRQSETLATLKADLAGKRSRLAEAEQLRLVREFQGAVAARRQVDERLAEYAAEDREILRLLSVEAPEVLQGKLAQRDDLAVRIADARMVIDEQGPVLAGNRFGEDRRPPTTGELGQLDEKVADLQEAATKLEHARDARDDQAKAVDLAEKAAVTARGEAATVRDERAAWPDAATLTRADDARRDAEVQEEKLSELAPELVRVDAAREASMRRLAAILPEAAVREWLSSNAPVPATGAVSEAVQRAALAQGTLDEATDDLAAKTAAATAMQEDGEAATMAVPALRGWIDRYEPAVENGRGSGGALVYGVLVLAAILVGLLAVLVHPGFWAALLLVGGLGAVVFAHGRKDSSGGTAAATVSLPPSIELKEWTFAEVHRVLSEQQAVLLRWEACRETVVRAQALEEERARSRERAAVAAREAAGAFLEAFGAAADSVEPTQIDDCVTALGDLRAAVDEAATLRAKQKEFTERLAEKMNETALGLPHLSGEALPTTPAAAKELLARTKSRCEELAEREQAVVRAEEKLREERTRMNGAEAAVEAAQSDHDAVLASTRQAFGQWLGDEVDEQTASGVRGLLTDLRDERQVFLNAEGAAATARRDLEKLAPELERAETEIDGWFAKYGFVGGRGARDGHRDRLGELEAVLPAYQKEEQARDAALRDERAAEDKLARAQVPEALRELSPEALAERAAALTTLEGEAENLQKEINAIEFEVQRLCDEDELEEAAGAVEKAREDVRAMRERVVLAEAGAAILAKLKDRFLRENSATLDEAGRLLNEFSGHAYELSVSTTNGPRLAATFVKHGSRKPQPLRQLSSNTRVQALMAARLAFLRTQEREWGGLRLPLIVDEALAIADPEGADSVMRALVAEARAGRQVLYFTAQPNEIRQWQGHLQSLAGEECPRWVIHDGMGDCRSLLEPAKDSWRPAGLPRPQAGEAMMAFVERLGVPQLQPWREEAVAEAHVYYVLDDDPGQLSRLASRCETVGELDGWLSRMEPEFEPLGQLFSGEELAGLIAGWRRRRAILRDLIGLWRVGRVPPLSHAELLEDEYLTANQAEKAAALLEQVAGEPTEFLSRLGKIKGFGPGTLNKLTDKLAENGRLPEGESQSREEVLRELLRRHPGSEADVRLVVVRAAHLWGQS